MSLSAPGESISNDQKVLEDYFISDQLKKRLVIVKDDQGIEHLQIHDITRKQCVLDFIQRDKVDTSFKNVIEFCLKQNLDHPRLHDKIESYNENHPKSKQIRRIVQNVWHPEIKETFKNFENAVQTRDINQITQYLNVLRNAAKDKNISLADIGNKNFENILHVLSKAPKDAYGVGLIEKLYRKDDLTSDEIIELSKHEDSKGKKPLRDQDALNFYFGTEDVKEGSLQKKYKLVIAKGSDGEKYIEIRKVKFLQKLQAILGHGKAAPLKVFQAGLKKDVRHDAFFEKLFGMVSREKTEQPVSKKSPLTDFERVGESGGEGAIFTELKKLIEVYQDKGLLEIRNNKNENVLNILCRLLIENKISVAQYNKIIVNIEKQEILPVEKLPKIIDQSVTPTLNNYNRQFFVKENVDALTELMPFLNETIFDELKKNLKRTERRLPFIHELVENAEIPEDVKINFLKALENRDPQLVVDLIYMKNKNNEDGISYLVNQNLGQQDLHVYLNEIISEYYEPPSMR